LKIFNYYFKVILDEYENSLNSKIKFSEKIDILYNFFSIYQGVNAKFNPIILSNNQLSILREEFKNISLIDISHKILEILDYIEGINLLILEITSNNLEISEKINKIENYILKDYKAINTNSENSQIFISGKWSSIIEKFNKILNDRKKEIFNNFESVLSNNEELYNLSSKFTNKKIILYVQDCIKYLYSIWKSSL